MKFKSTTKSRVQLAKLIAEVVQVGEELKQDGLFDHKFALLWNLWRSLEEIEDYREPS